MATRPIVVSVLLVLASLHCEADMLGRQARVQVFYPNLSTQFVPTQAYATREFTVADTGVEVPFFGESNNVNFSLNVSGQILSFNFNDGGCCPGTVAFNGPVFTLINPGGQRITGFAIIGSSTLPIQQSR